MVSVVATRTRPDLGRLSTPCISRCNLSAARSIASAAVSASSPAGVGT